MMPDRVTIHEDLIEDISKALVAVKAAGPGVELMADRPAWFYSDTGQDFMFSITYRLDDAIGYYEVSI